MARGDTDPHGKAIKAGAGDGTIIRELDGTLRPAIQPAINQKRLALGKFYVPIPQTSPARDFGSPARKRRCCCARPAAAPRCGIRARREGLVGHSR
jgi:hypothetical protein